MDVILIVVGLALLTIGGEALVRGSVELARRLRAPEAVIGLTLVGFGASVPELAASVEAAFEARPALAFGAVAGSNIANLLLVVGLAAAVRPIEAPRRALWGDAGAATLALVAFAACVRLPVIDATIGAALAAALVLYVIWSWWGARERPAPAPEAAPAPIWLAVLFAVSGIGFTTFGAKSLVEGCIRMSTDTGAADSVLGLTIVGLGASLPELTAAVIAALRGRGSLALGSALGAVIYNVFGVLGVTAMVRPIAPPRDIAAFDVWVMAGAGAAVLAAALLWRVLSRRAGWALLLGYSGYMYWLYTRFPQ